MYAKRTPLPTTTGRKLSRLATREAARRATAQEATDQLHEAIRQALADNHTLRAVAQATGYSYQRISQIAHGGR